MSAHGNDEPAQPLNPYIPRQLIWFDTEGRVVCLAEAALSSQPLPAVVLGDPGMGKTELLRRLAKQPGHHYLTAAQFLRRPLSRVPTGVLLLDALDEVSAGQDSDPLDRLLLRLAEADSPPFILSCRAADWRGSMQARAIADDYSRPPRVLTLQPLSNEEGYCLLEAKLGPPAAREFHSALMRHGLSDLLSNPQSLGMLLDVAADGVPEGEEIFSCARHARWSRSITRPMFNPSSIGSIKTSSLTVLAQPWRCCC